MNKIIEKRKIRRVLFYPGHVRTLRSIMIGHLYEIAQAYPVVMLSDEEIDKETETIIRDKKLFPRLEKVIVIPRHVNPENNTLKRLHVLNSFFKKIIGLYRPDIVIASNDFVSSRLYLMRIAKKADALNLSIEASPEMNSASERKSVDLVNACIRFPSFLPKSLRYYLTQCRKYVGHFLYHWIFPLMVGERPFLGKSSSILRKGKSGMRDADYQIVFSEKEYDIYVKEGFPREKLYILKHPLLRQPTRDFFKKKLLGEEERKVTKKTAVLLIPPEEVGFRRKDDSLISKEEREEEKIKIVSSVVKILKDWKIFVKPHPDLKNFEEVRRLFESVSGNIKVVDPSESIEKYIKESRIVIGLPKSISTALFTASLLFPEKAILSLDLEKEILGDFYKDSDGIEYIDSEKKLAEILKSIRDNKYQRGVGKRLEKKERFADTVELLEYLFNKKIA